MATARNRSQNSANQHSALKMMGVAALGVAAGLAANFGRKLAVQAPGMFAGSWRDALATEHRAVLKLFDAMEATSDRQTTRRAMLLYQIKHALGRHAFQEENVIYPAMREHGAREEAERLVVEHGDVKHYLFELDTMPNNGASFLSTIASLRESLEAHMKAEEQEIFPAFDAKLGDAERKALMASMNKEGLKLA